MNRRATIGVAIFFSIFLLPNLVHASTEGSTAALFEYLNGNWLDVGTVNLERGMVADIDGDKSLEQVLAAKPGELPVVRITALAEGTQSEFSAYDSGMRKGFDLAVGDLDGDGVAEIITAAGPGTNGHVRILDQFGQPKFFATGLFPFDSINRGGAFVSTADLDGDGIEELLIGSGPGSSPRVQVWSVDDRNYWGEFQPFLGENNYGVRVLGADLNYDGRDEIVVSSAYGGGLIRVFDGLSFAQQSEFAPFGNEFDGGIRMAVFSVPNPGLNGLAIEPAGESAENRSWLPQYVTVDISEQRLRAYEYGREVKTFLVSTGRWNYPTPLGEFEALAKPEYVHYVWSYGQDHPENYDLGVVRWNVRFYPHVYIHYAPWHNNFGQRMSHGCVNISRDSAEWIYNWINLGTPITTKM
ncbi:L,D-transpeptidase family protein [Patescibacteria group bacterium]|nr:L,D-transpeptidase family protein [Patescibacteria group bacterium]MBU1029346.1 L,D-transpeptidase family protein [Patescibacteria group bacterium]